MPADATVAADRPGRGRRDAAADSSEGGAPPLTSRRWWPAVKRTATVLFFVVVVALVAQQARTVDWPQVGTALRAYPAATLAWAALLVVASHAVYCTYDLIGRQQTGHRLPAWRVAGVGFVSYAFNLNLGSLVGGVAFRFRLYSRLGLDTDVIARVFVLSLITNWIGYLLLAGTVFVLRPLALPPTWKLGSDGLQVLGAALLVLVVVYIGACFFATRREWVVRGHTLKLPSGRIAMLQLLLSSINWSLMAGVVWLLLQQAVDYPAVLSVLLVAAVAGVITHVPAGLGVLEAVFIALLSHRAAKGDLLAALLAYRAMYYLAPLLAASVLFWAVDRTAARVET